MDHVEAIKAIDSGAIESGSALLTIASLAASNNRDKMLQALGRICEVTFDPNTNKFVISSLIEPPFHTQIEKADAREISSQPMRVLQTIFAAACGVEYGSENTAGSEQLTSAYEDLGRAAPDDLSYSDYPPKIVRDLGFGNDVLLVGPSASGKTVIAYQVAQLLQHSGGECYFIDINATVEDYWQKLLGILLRIFNGSATEGRTTIIIDNVQGSTRQFALAMNVFDLAVSLSENEVNFFFVGWPSVAGLSRLEPADIRKIVIDNRAQADLILCRSIALRADKIARGEIGNIIDGDCFLAHEIAKSADKGELTPSFSLLAKSSMQSVVGDEEISMPGRDFLYTLSALGMVEIFANEAWLLSIVSVNKREINSFTGLRRLGSAVSIGHRSRAYVVNRFLAESDPTLSTRLGSVQEIVHQYCTNHGDEAILQALDRIDVPNEAIDDADRPTSHVPSRLWLAFVSLRNRIRALAIQDPTWGANTASVCMALTVLRLIDWSAWQSSYEFVTSAWQLKEGGVSRELDTIERDDFDAIKERMALQDQELENSVPRIWEGADGIDSDRMHMNWVLGLLLMAEGTARKVNRDRVRGLADQALAQIDAVGAIYPRRVPWVGARLISGLTAVGLTSATSKDVERATSWLLTSAPAGPRQTDHWMPGTGTWNDDYQATAMVLASCLEAGVSPSDSSLIAASDFLDRNRENWVQEGSEITIIDVVITQISLGKRWEEYADAIEIVLKWILDAAHWNVESARVKATEVGYESSKIAQVSARTLDLIFNILKSNLDYVVGQGIRRFDRFAEYVARFEDQADVPDDRLREETLNAYRILRDHLDGEFRQRARLVAAREQNAQITSVISELKGQIRSLQKIRLRMDAEEVDWENVACEIDEIGISQFGDEWHILK